MKRPYLLILLVIILINFLLPRLMPGDPFTTEALDDSFHGSSYTPGQIERYKAYYSMDKPIYVQLVRYFGKILVLDLGYSLRFRQNVSELILIRLPWTFGIVIVSLLFSTLLGVSLGAFSALRSRRKADGALYFGMVVFSEVPSFLIGILLLFTLGAGLGWFPLAGARTTFATFDSLHEQILDVLHHAALPVITLTLSQIGGFYLIGRSSMVTVLDRDYIRTAKGKGVGERRLLFRHALKNAAPPIISKLFMSLGMMLSGAVLIENVFNYPGIGRLMREAVMARDYVLIQGVFLCLAVMILFLSFLTDFFHSRLDPRLYEKGNNA